MSDDALDTPIPGAAHETRGPSSSGVPQRAPTASDTSDADDLPSVRAAGAVLWRRGDDDHVEVAVVHRPRYDDWSLPKGKLADGELAAEAAVREVGEETGFRCSLSRFLRQVRYPVPALSAPQGMATKVVDYYAAHAQDGAFASNGEVDELRWCRVEQAHDTLTYPHDSEVLDGFTSIPTEAHTVLLVRHAKAGKRSEWHDDDTLRPLTDAGRAQRDVLHRVLPLFAPRRVHSAPRVRCTDTVAPIARDLGTGVHPEPLLSEEGYAADPGAGLRRLLDIARLPGTSVVCSQGGVIPAVVAELAATAGLELGEVPSKKGSVWNLTLHGNSDGADPALRLLAANYVPAP